MTGNSFRVGLVPSNSFKDGAEPWNKNIKGIHLSPSTEFKVGRTSKKHVPVGTESVLADKSGSLRVWVKIAEPGKWAPRAQLVWEAENGQKIPEGHVVHHVNRVSTDDAPGNLMLLTRAQHITEHRAEHEAKRKEAVSRSAKLRWEKYRVAARLGRDAIGIDRNVDAIEVTKGRVA
jgi:hypothetical protein